MPDGHFSRNKEASTGRKFGEAPLIGKVPRSPDSAVAHGGRSSTRRRRKHGIRVRAWTALLLTVTLSIILLIVVAYVRVKSELTVDSDDHLRSSQLLESAFSAPAKTQSDFLSESEALEIVSAALAITDPARVRDFFNIGEKDNAQTAIESLISLTRKEGAMIRVRWLGEKFIEGRVLSEVVVFMGDGKSKRLAQLALGDDGKWRIDLDSYLRKVSPNWEKILSGASDSSLVRVFIATDHYYNGNYSDETTWKAYTLSSADVPDLLYAYARRGSPQQRALDKLLSSPAPVHRTTLEILKKSKSGQRQFEISRVIAASWAITGEDFDQSF